MKKYILVGLLMVLFIPCIFALDVRADYQIIENKVLVELNLGEVQNFELKLPYDARTIEISTKDYEIVEFDNYKLLRINYASDLNLKYITGSLIEKSRNKYFFILKNKLNLSANISVFLPEGAVLTEELFVLPKEDSILTDGRRIIITWREFEDGQIVVAYKFIGESYFIYLLLALILVIGLVLYIARLKRTGKPREKAKLSRVARAKKIRRELTINLFREEKKIIDYLLKKKRTGCWTKEIVRDLSIPKVRLSRKLRSLEQKGLVKKIPFGNENRIKLLR